MLAVTAAVYFVIVTTEVAVFEVSSLSFVCTLISSNCRRGLRTVGQAEVKGYCRDRSAQSQLWDYCYCSVVHRTSKCWVTGSDSTSKRRRRLLPTAWDRKVSVVSAEIIGSSVDSVIGGILYNYYIVPYASPSCCGQVVVQTNQLDQRVALYSRARVFDQQRF